MEVLIQVQKESQDTSQIKPRLELNDVSDSMR